MDILVIEDHRDIRDNLVEYFSGKGHSVDSAIDGLTGLHLAVTKSFDAILLDIGLPGIDGNQICRNLRQHLDTGTAIIMLSARDNLEDRLTCFKAGGDDFVTKPFAMSEVLARVEAVVSRYQGKADCLLSVADLTLDLNTLEVSRNGVALKLNPTCMKLLELLMRKSPCMARRAELEAVLWGSDTPNCDSLRTSIHMLRRAVDKGFEKPLIHTIHGFGYKICEGD